MFAYDHLMQQLGFGVVQKTWCNSYHVPTRFSNKVRNLRKEAHDQIAGLFFTEPAVSVFPQPWQCPQWELGGVVG